MRKLPVLIAALAILFVFIGLSSSIASASCTGVCPGMADDNSTLQQQYNNAVRGGINPDGTVGCDVCPGPAAAPQNVQPRVQHGDSARCQFSDQTIDHEMHNGDIFYVPAGTTVKGDVEVSANQNGPFQKAYPPDNDGTHGNILHMGGAGYIKAQWGANASCDEKRDDASMRYEVATVGCSGGCAWVHDWFWDGNKVSASQPLSKDQILGQTNNQTQTTPAANAPSDCEDNLNVSQTKTVKAGCVVAGDVTVNGHVLYDNKPNTGLIVVLKQDAQVYAPYGASVHDGTDIDDIVHGLWGAGCGPHGCAWVNVVTMPNGTGDWRQRPGDFPHQ